MKLKPLLRIASLLLLAAMLMPAQADAQSLPSSSVGTLTMYYATRYLKVKSVCLLNTGDYDLEYHAGDLILDSNHPYCYIVKLNGTTYQYREEEFGPNTRCSFNLPMAYVEVKTYTMSKLPVSSIGQSARFVSKGGLEARIFKSTNNGHHFRSTDGVDYGGGRPEGCYILSAQLGSDDKNCYVEEMLETKSAFFDFYNTIELNGKNKTIGSISLNWRTGENWPCDKSAYDVNGKLITDLYEIPLDEFYSIAYVADLDALYLDGTLYYREKDTSQTVNGNAE